MTPDDRDKRADRGETAPDLPPTVRRHGSGFQVAARGPKVWRLAPEAWRLSARLTPAQLDRYLRLRSAKALPRSVRARFAAMRIPNESIDRVLGDIRTLDRWMDAWNQAAQRFLTEARREEKVGGWREAAEARVSAAMCFHAAHLVTDTDPRTVRTLRASSVTTFAQAVPRLFPETHKIGLPWRNRHLPAYLALPVAGDPPFPLLVMLNGATTCKEELLLWSDRILAAGVAVLTVDWPGTGESASLGPPAPDCDDLTDAVVDLAEDDPALDPEMIVLLGFSLGGTVALRSTALDRRVGGGIAVTPPYDPPAWWRYVNPIVRQQLLSMSGNVAAERDALARFSLRGELDRLRSPILLFGAGRDLVVPPEETLHVAADGGDLATVCWYPNGSHGLYAEIPDWTALAARWVNGLFGREVVAAGESPVEDDEGSGQETSAAGPPSERAVGDEERSFDAAEVGVAADAGNGEEPASAGTQSTRVESPHQAAESDIWDDDEE